MLRASATATDQPTDLAVVRDPTADGGVDAAEELAHLVAAVVEGGPDGATAARTGVLGRLGASATVDAVAIVANFEMMTRIADGTGAVHESVDADVARSTGAERFTSAP